MPSFLRLLAITLLLSFTTGAATAVENDELESMLNVLRARGYNLFSNAIATSDLIYEILTGKSFTFFAPTDSSLFTLDMTTRASDYVSTLRCHVIPFRVPFTELRRLNSGSSLPTLFKDHQATVRVERLTSMTSSDDVVTVDGVGVLLPGLFSSRNIAVHGLRGLLNCRSDQESKMQASTRYLPVNKHSHAHPPPSNLSPQIDEQSSKDVNNPKATSPSPANFPDDYRFNSPSTSNVLNQIAPPNSGEFHDSSITSPEPEPPISGGFSSVERSDAGRFPSQISPAYDLWLEAPTSVNFAPGNQPGSPPEFSENDDPTAFPPSTTDAAENQGDHIVATYSDLSSLKENELSLIKDDEWKTAVSDNTPVISTEDMAGIMKTEPEKSQPLDEATFDCTVTDGFDHVIFPHGYVYTRQPMSCNSA